MELLIVIGGLCIVHLFAGAYTQHRQACRRRRRALLTAAVAAVHRQDLEESRQVIGGSGARR